MKQMIDQITNVLKALPRDIVGDFTWDGVLKNERSYRVIIEITDDSDAEGSDDDGNNDLPTPDSPPLPYEEPLPVKKEKSEGQPEGHKVIQMYRTAEIPAPSLN